MKRAKTNKPRGRELVKLGGGGLTKGKGVGSSTKGNGESVDLEGGGVEDGKKRDGNEKMLCQSETCGGGKGGKT